MRKVLVFKETLLPPSGTFILTQLESFRGFEAKLSGLERVRPSLAIDADALVLTQLPLSISTLRAKLYRRTGIAPLFHRRCKEFNPDLVHAHFASGGHTAMTLADALRVPLIVTLHGSDVTVRSKHSDYYGKLADRAACFVCVSKFIRDCALAIGFPSEKLAVHYIGVDREHFAPPTTRGDSTNVLFVGRLVEKKGCEYLLRAMHLVQREHANCELTIIGDGPLRRKLESLANELQIRCTSQGVQPAVAVHAPLREAQILCVPSITAANGDSEGFGMVFAEAQSMGVPVVSSMHGGVPEAVQDGESGPSETRSDLQQHCLLFLEMKTCGGAFAAQPSRTSKGIPTSKLRQLHLRKYMRLYWVDDLNRRFVGTY